MRRFASLLFLAPFTLAHADSLETLHSTLIEMRAKISGPVGPRASGPQLTAAKHQLRNWVESRLSMPPALDERQLERDLNRDLRYAGLFCGDDIPGQAPCPDWTLSGFLNPLKLSRSHGFLILQTGVGIECGFDESAYVFESSGQGWRRVWQTEQNTYIEGSYKPQTIRTILLSPDNVTRDFLVLTLGTEPWCASNWHDVYWRAFRLGPDLASSPLIDGAERAYMSVDEPIRGSVTTGDILVEFRTASIDSGVHNRAAIRHYRTSGGQAKRIDPFALSPRDFVDEWLTREWSEVSPWSEPTNQRKMQGWHAKARNSAEFTPTKHCRTSPDLWQVSITSDPPDPIHFLVQWKPPFKFTMVDVNAAEFPNCNEEDPSSDEDRTLFPGGH